jgi:hypothetical protein
VSVDAEEEAKLTHVLHGKFGSETINDLLKKRRRGAGEDDVVHVE